VGEKGGETVRLTVADDSAVRNEGSVLVLEGIDAEGNVWWFAVDRRAGLDVIHDCQAGLTVELEIEDWQILGSAR